jgi:hypothetical protein
MEGNGRCNILQPDATYEPDVDLEPAQHKAIAVLATGGTVAAAATAAGVDRVTVWRWRTQDTEFAAALNRALRDQAEAIATQRRALACEAIATIRELMMGPYTPRAIRLRAAQAALNAVGGLAVPAYGATDAKGVEDEWFGAQNS